MNAEGYSRVRTGPFLLVAIAVLLSGLSAMSLASRVAPPPGFQKYSRSRNLPPPQGPKPNDLVAFECDSSCFCREFDGAYPLRNYPRVRIRVRLKFPDSPYQVLFDEPDFAPTGTDTSERGLASKYTFMGEVPRSQDHLDDIVTALGKRCEWMCYAVAREREFRYMLSPVCCSVPGISSASTCGGAALE